LAKEKFDVLSRLSNSTARHARHDERDMHSRFQGRSYSVDWMDMPISPFSKVVPEIDANPEHKRLNLYTRALLLLRRPRCWNKHSATHTTRATRHVT